MPRGPAGGPRPFADAKLLYQVRFRGPSGMETRPKKAPEVFEKGSRTPQEDALQFFIRQIGNVLLAVNFLAHPSSAVVNSIEIKEQKSGMTEWEVEYFLKGVGMGEFGRFITSANAMCKARRVMIEGDDTPIENTLAVKRGRFETGPFKVEGIRVRAV